jgi:hypothetical protein
LWQFLKLAPARRIGAPRLANLQKSPAAVVGAAVGFYPVEAMFSRYFGAKTTRRTVSTAYLSAEDHSASRRLHSQPTVVLIAPMTRLRTGLARVATLLATILIATWTAVKFVLDWMGRTTMVEDYQEFLKRLPKWAEWLFSTPGWVPATLASALALFLMWLSWPRERTEPAVARVDPEPDARQPAIAEKLAAATTRVERTSATSARRSSSYIKEISVHGGSAAQKLFPGYVLRFAKSGKGGQVLVDFSAFVGGVGGGWTQRRTIPLRDLDRFARDAEISGPLISADSIDSEVWSWGGTWLSPPTGGVNVVTIAGHDSSTRLMRQCVYRGRIVFQDEDGDESRCYFIITQSAMAASREMPHVVGSQLFDFVAEWEANGKTPG